MGVGCMRRRASILPFSELHDCIRSLTNLLSLDPPVLLQFASLGIREVFQHDKVPTSKFRWL